jgi:hypothetical protein
MVPKRAKERDAESAKDAKTFGENAMPRYRLARAFLESERSVSLSLTHLSQQKYNRFILDK